MVDLVDSPRLWSQLTSYRFDLDLLRDARARLQLARKLRRMKPVFAQDRDRFLAALRAEVEEHPAVHHALLARIAQTPLSREARRVFALQCSALIGTATRCLELLLRSAPDSDTKLRLAKVLVEEYGDGSEGQDHAALYRRFLSAAGATGEDELHTRLHRDVAGFITAHLAICRAEPFLVGLGALGPGHEWAVPKMFDQLVRGLSRTGLSGDDLRWFELHLDPSWGAWLEPVLARYAVSEETRQQIFRGAMLSLEARARFWSGIEEKILPR
jgi:pyrroloquinoline quinone (PQQ) biosynthesis protein C